MPVILANKHFWAKGQIYAPGDDGELVEIKFRGRFKRLSATERKELDRRLYANGITPDVRKELEKMLEDTSPSMSERDREELRLGLEAERISNEEFIELYLTDWDIKDQDGNPIAFSPENLKEVFEELDGLPAALVKAYDQAVIQAANPAAIEKNSGKQSVPSTPGLPRKR